MDSRTIPQEDLYANQNGIEGQEDQQSQTSREFDPEKSETIWCKHCGNNVPGRRDRTSACNLCGNTLVNIAAGQISPDNVGFGTTLSGEICLLLGEATKRAKEAYVQIDALNQTGDLRLGHAQIEFLTAIATLVNASDRVNTVEREKTEQAMPP